MLNLPTELRLQIWEYVFPGGEYIPIVINPSRGTMSTLRHVDAYGEQSATPKKITAGQFVNQKAWSRHRRGLLRHGYQLKSLMPGEGIFQVGKHAMLLDLALTCHKVYGHIAT